jgi:arylformamidase
MRILDISVGIDEKLPVWPGDPQPALSWVGRMTSGDIANISAMSMGAHTGTHIDAPLHFLEDADSLDHIALSALIGEAQVLEVPEDVTLITADVLSAGEQIHCERVLLKTRNSRFWEGEGDRFRQDFTALDVSAAEYLVQRGVCLVGIDYLSIAPYEDPAPTHTLLLQAKVVILECVNLSEAAAGRYQLVCLPMKLTGREAAPARAVLISDEMRVAI